MREETAYGVPTPTYMKLYAFYSVCLGDEVLSLRTAW
jgi:hypothetical protein